MHEGTIARVDVRGFGFIRIAGGESVFFHCSELADGMEFGKRLVELRVKFRIATGDRGLKAVGIQPAD